MIFIIDNGEAYEDHGIHFVEAPPAFEAWFNKVLIPWAKNTCSRIVEDRAEIMGVAEGVTWRSGSTQSVEEFIERYYYFSPKQVPPIFTTAGDAVENDTD